MTALDKRLVIRIGEELEAWLAATSQRIGCDRATFARMALTELMNSGVEPRAPFQMASGSAPHLAPVEYEYDDYSVLQRIRDQGVTLKPSEDALIAERLAEAPAPRPVPRTETGELLNGGPPAMSLRHVERNKFNPGRA